MVAALAAWHDRHEDAARALAGVTALPAHVLLESYAVLTRLPRGLAVPAAAAADVLARRFPDEPFVLFDRGPLPRRLAGAGVYGGSTYDGLAALEAEAHGQTLVTLDRRAEQTYRRLGVRFEAL